MSYSSLGGSQTLFRSSNINQNEHGKGFAENEPTQQEKFNQILIQAQELVQKDQVDAAISKLRLLVEKINLMKQAKKEYDRKLELICIYNLAAAYQKQWSLDDCIPLLEKFIALVKINLQENLKASGALGTHQSSHHKHWFKLKTTLIRAMLQYCAVLSQIGEHRKALRTAIEITGELKALFKRGYDECSRQIAKREALQAKRVMKKDVKTGVDKIQFSFSVLLSARDSLQQLCKMQIYSEINENPDFQAQMQEVKSHIYYWKSIPENNIKTLRQSFQVASSNEQPQEQKRKNERNLLGVKRNQDWIEQFTIAKVMFMSPLNYLEFTDPDNLIFQFNHRNLVEKIFFLSVAYFSLSIELRFLEEEGPEKRKKRREGQNKEKTQLQLSQILHLKSIEVVCKHIKQNSAFVNHLVFNYHKHYKNNLNTIEEENSLAQYSELYDPKKPSKNEENLEDQSLSLNSNVLILPTSTVYRKDSIYYQEQPEISKTQQVSSVNKQKNQSKDQEPAIYFKKPLRPFIEDNAQQITNLASSTSFSRREDIVRKDKTLKKIGSAKMITLGKFDLQQLDRNDRSEKQISYKQISSRSIKQKSLSRSKNVLKNSMTLKQNKSSSPTKQRNSKSKNLRDLKTSGDLRRDFAKKKSPEQYKGLDLLKKSGSLHQFTGKNLKDSGNLYTSPDVLRLKKKS